jgi:hypothetical protein
LTHFWSFLLVLSYILCFAKFNFDAIFCIYKINRYGKNLFRVLRNYKFGIFRLSQGLIWCYRIRSYCLFPRREELLWVSERALKEEPDLCETLKKLNEKSFEIWFRNGFLKMAIFNRSLYILFPTWVSILF